MSKKKKMEVGEAVIEFYASFDLIKEYYEQKGYRKITLLHKVLKEKLSWEMGYDTFRYHFNKEFKKTQLSITNESANNQEEKTIVKKSKEPIIAVPNFSKVRRFNP
jgi:hypothetical protein